jgi:hypothetical protein
MKWRNFIDKNGVVNLVGIFLLGHPAERAATPAGKKRHTKAVTFLRRVETLQKVRSLEVASLAIAQAELLL